MQRWPAVPTAAKSVARSARSRSALGVTIDGVVAAEFEERPAQPLGRRPRRPRRPIRQLPVAEISGSRRSSIIRSPTSAASPTQRLKTPAQPFAAATRLTMFCTAIAVSGVSGDGFQIIVSPQTAASSAFQAQTATGKLNAVMTPTGPSGCHCSNIRCSGRSLAIVSPWSCRDRPTAKSHMSIISWTSPSPSAEDLAGLQRDEPAEVVLVLAERHADLADDLAPARRRDHPPGQEGLRGPSSTIRS